MKKLGFIFVLSALVSACSIGGSVGVGGGSNGVGVGLGIGSGVRF